jgi:disulfide bond formation protein DsbB
VIVTRRQRRSLNLAGLAIAAGLLGYALFAEHVQGLEPCPLCIFQRIAMIAVGSVFLIAALHAPRGLSARVYAALGALTAAVGAGVAGWHVYLQNLPPGAAPPDCGASLDYLFDVFGPLETIRMVLASSGECTDVDWSFVGLSMPAWVLIWFVLLGGLAVYANWSRLGGSGLVRAASAATSADRG